ncbi:asparagine synthase (glutamine-hydrolyzing) [Caulobacter segnis]|uniref:asparagine synthase (glutamine-hydrolyzing) n=1 Tax=Caulobacter segnis TaxID=88688 RepID=UPI0024100BB8|nr:asparagine synthase (glutamine-hydrolyzing) [Caulobacter segnis]MDG2523396.1 asparagine synthase (glutamine-hydrolyzing) [Caulobacter segnis]
MCGIAGVLGNEASAAPLIATLAHRGPDGVRTEDGRGWSIGHARLSIIDLEGGWQPLHAAGGTVIGNGEIYNYVELTEQFGLKDKLSTGSDFEPLLHLYALEGPKAFARLRGMYAFCLIGGDGRTWLVRDRFGIKPLYYTAGSDGVRFASEPRALARGPMVPERAQELLALNYTLGEETIFAGVKRLAPGAVVEVKDGRALSSPLGGGGPRSGGGGSADSASPLRPPGSPPPKGEDLLIQTLDAVLENSVSVHQRSDVPYGLFLSGGIDSTAIATLMSRLNARPVTAFTCGFDVAEARDERAQAEKVARALNLDWRETTFTEDDFWRLAPQAAWALDDPTSDYAVLPTLKLTEAAKGTLTVVLSGEGGDELFAGYGRYRRALRPRWLGGRAAEPQVDVPMLADGGAGALMRWRAATAGIEGSLLKRSQAADIATWLPHDLLLKLDRCLMAVGLEGRTPFLDPEVAAFADALPDRMKVRGRYGKWILRKWLERACPAADPWGKKKGFTVPVAAWIAPRAAGLGPRLAALPAIARVCDVEAVRAVFADEAHASKRWPLLFFGLWSLIHLEGLQPGDALKTLLDD